MKNNLLKLFGKIRRSDTAHADEGFQVSSDGAKTRVERRQNLRRHLATRRASNRNFSIDRRVIGLERRLGIDWRAWL